MSLVGIEGRSATVVWEGDVAVLGAGLAGLQAALTLARQGRRTCLVEPGPALGVEVSGMWVNELPPGPLADALLALCEQQGAGRRPRLDIFVATLAFDRMVEEAGVKAVVRALPMRLLADAQRRLTGVEIVGKSGRQVVRAPIVVDATPARRFTRRALGLPAPAVVSAERRCHVHGVDAAADLTVPPALGLLDNAVRVIPAVWPHEALLALRVSAAPGASRADLLHRTLRAAVDLVAHLRSAEPRFRDVTLVDVSSVLRCTFEADGAALSGLAAAGLHALPLAAEVGDEIARAAAVAAGLPRRAPGRLSAASARPRARRLRTSELAAAPEQDLKNGRLPAASAEEHEAADVVVAGWGAAGAFAAIAAAERCKRVVVLAPDAVPGGIATAGQIPSYYHGVPGGMQEAIDRQVDALSRTLEAPTHRFHPTAKAVILSGLARERRVEVGAGHVVFGTVMKGRRVAGVLSADEDGYHCFPCRVAIDCTGDGDLAAATGAATLLGRAGDGFPQPYSYTPSFMQGSTLAHRNFDAGWTDPTDTLEYSRAHFHGRRELWRQGPFTAERHYCTLASLLGLRESRFIRARTLLTMDDFVAGRSFPDAIGTGRAHYDNHAVDYGEESDWSYRYVALCGLWARLFEAALPYRALLPEGVEGLLVAGRAIGVDHDAHQLLRMQRDMQTLGTAAGVAAAMAVRDGILPSAVDVAALRRRLSRLGVRLKPEPTVPPSLSTDDLLRRLGTDDNGLAMWRLAARGAQAQPDWEAFLRSESDPRRRFCGALAATLAGRRVAPALAELRETVARRVEGPRLGTKSPPLYVAAALALAGVGEPGMTETLGALLADPELKAPDLVLVLRGLGALGDPGGVQPIRDFLARTEDEPFLHPLWGADAKWPTSLRFLVELRAIHSLLALGCRAENGRLAKYVNDERLLIRRHARRLRAMGEKGSRRVGGRGARRG